MYPDQLFYDRSKFICKSCVKVYLQVMCQSLFASHVSKFSDIKISVCVKH